jgi:hypothetical protein
MNRFIETKHTKRPDILGALFLYPPPTALNGTLFFDENFEEWRAERA